MPRGVKGSGKPKVQSIQNASKKVFTPEIRLKRIQNRIDKLTLAVAELENERAAIQSEQKNHLKEELLKRIAEAGLTREDLMK